MPGGLAPSPAPQSCCTTAVQVHRTGCEISFSTDKHSTFHFPGSYDPRCWGCGHGLLQKCTAGQGQRTAPIPAASRAACSRDGQGEHKNLLPSLPHVCCHPATHCLRCFSSKMGVFLPILFHSWSIDRRKPVDSSAKIPTELHCGLKEANHSWRVPLCLTSVQTAPLQITPVKRWAAALFCCQPRHQSRENYCTQRRKCFLWQQLRKCYSSCIQPACSCIIKRAIEQSFKKFTGSHFSWTKASAPIIPQCWVHVAQILSWAQSLFLTDAGCAWKQKYEPWNYL